MSNIVSRLKILLTVHPKCLFAFGERKTGPVILSIFPSRIQMQMGAFIYVDT